MKTEHDRSEKRETEAQAERDRIEALLRKHLAVERTDGAYAAFFAAFDGNQ